MKYPRKPIICVVGLGYVGLPIAILFAKEGFKTYGFEI
jgi:UDP-N-acetyl-D-mannosaminuronate dehydrogenase